MMIDDDNVELWNRLVDALDPDALGDAIDEVVAMSDFDLGCFLADAAGVALAWKIRAGA